MHRIQKERNAPGILWDYFNRLSNLFFMMALYENQAEAIEEIPFLSRSYDS
ncbi:cob(I)alamin adenosyltransferase [Faecalicoccus acidiformans]|uniref:Cob(I)alamin adenosyltransferase n=2 Tax=Faecalicoccus TaxID=1573536 RepID=A0A7W8D2L7_9FIRM|nr:cob(I)alamin adenosyltransferase [Faecalicoccus acidiformans]